MAVDPCGVYLGDDGRLLEHAGNNQRVRNHPAIAFIASFSSAPEVQELTRFLDVSGIPGVKAPGSFHLYIPTRLPGHRGHPCYDRIHDFRNRSTGA
jgi:hypothetical protein